MMAEAGLEGGGAPRRRADRRGRTRSASSSRAARTRATRPRRSSSRSSGLKKLRALRRRAERRAGTGLVPDRPHPEPAKQVIKQGKLAVIVGIESSDLFNCSEFMDQPRGTKARRRLRHRAVQEAGVSGACSSPTGWTTRSRARRWRAVPPGSFIGILEALADGRVLHKPGPVPKKGPGRGDQHARAADPEVPVQFFPDAKKVSRLSRSRTTRPASSAMPRASRTWGHYLVRRMMANHILIEVDHRASGRGLAVMKIAEAHDYPLVSSHTDTGGFWTKSDLQRLYAIGGFATARLDDPAQLADTILKFRREKSPSHDFGVGLGSDTAGSPSRPDHRRTPPRTHFSTRSPPTWAMSSSHASKPASAPST